MMVSRGDGLWRISRLTYGAGTRYVPDPSPQNAHWPFRGHKARAPTF